jgi:hypothetical protein
MLRVGCLELARFWVNIQRFLRLSWRSLLLL